MKLNQEQYHLEMITEFKTAQNEVKIFFLINE
jgi:hypothetical protein